MLTAHFKHPGFLRVQYLPNGDYLLTGPRVLLSRGQGRFNDAELWVLDRRLRRPPVRLGQKAEEGVAVSRRRPLIAYYNTAQQYPGRYAPGESVIYTARIAYRRGRPRLVGRRELLRRHRPACLIEPQDFRARDRELIYSCYHPPAGADVMGVSLRNGRVTAYRRVPGEYNEAEGISPDGRFILVESGRDRPDKVQDGAFIDIWKLRLRPHSRDFVRLTRWGDFPNYKASNPVVSPDGRTVAFQSARSSDPPGVGHGIFLLKLQSAKFGRAGGFLRSAERPS